MRLSIAIAVAVILAACALQQTGSERAFVAGDGSRAAQVASDANAILVGMKQARTETERLARETRRPDPDARPPALMR